MADQGTTYFDIPRLFSHIAEQVEQQREAFNAADTLNGDHGDHMVEIFRAAADSVPAGAIHDLPQALHRAAQSLLALRENGSAQVYGRGLESFGEAFAQAGISADELALYVRRLLAEQTAEDAGPEAQPVQAAQQVQAPERSQVLKALVNGLSAWKHQESRTDSPAPKMDLGVLFDLGITYMQARQRNESKIETIADAAVTSSPLNEVPHRAQSGKLAIRAFLEGLAAG